MATVVSGSQVKLNSGQVVQAQQGGWYDGQQFWGGTLSAPGVINSQSNQQGAGQAVSKEVVAQTNPANVAYVQQQQQNYQPSPTSQPLPSSNNAPSLGTGGAGGAGGGASIPFTAPEAINLPKMYEDLYASSGIRDLEASLNQKVMDTNEQISKIKNNPYLSEATMTGRISKLEEKALADQKALSDQIATKKADIETKLQLQTKQIDINNQQTQLAWDQFNTLLQSGALQNANGDTIANITRATGIPSDAIYSAIDAQNKKNNPVSVSTFTAENGEVFAVALDSTGHVVNKTSLGVIGNVQNKGGGGLTKAQETQANRDSLITSIKNGITLKSLVGYYGSVFDSATILQLYNLYSPFGTAKETLKDVQAGNFNY